MDYFLDKYGTTKKEKFLFFELAIAFYLNNNFTSSLNELAEAAGIDGPPDNAAILFLKGQNYKSLRKPKDALTAFMDAMQTTKDEALMNECEAVIKELLAGTDSAYLYEFVEQKALSFAGTNNLPKAEIFKNLIGYINLQRELDQQKAAILEEELQAAITTAGKLTEENNFETALEIVEAALVKQPDNTHLLFLKIRILIESQAGMDKAISLLTDEDYGYLHLHSDKTEIMQQVNKAIANKPDRGNTYFFAAFIGNITDYDKATVNLWVQKAEQLGLENKNTYNNTGVYLLKASIAQKQKDSKVAASNYLEAGKQFYWDASYSEAAKYFKRATETDAALRDAFRYYADTLFILSYVNYPPFADEAKLQEAFAAWHQCSETSVVNDDDAWHYIIIARIHESRYSFSSVNFYNDYWNALLYAERALIHSEKNVSFLTYLGRYFRLLGMEQNAGIVLEKAMALSSGGDTNLQEEMIIVQLNAGEFDKALEWLIAITDKNIREERKQPAHYKSWEAYIYFYRDKDYTKALGLFSEVLIESPGEIFALQMKMLSFWYSGDLAGAASAAAEILSMDNSRQYPREAFAFAWAFLIAGEAVTGISRMEAFQTGAGPGGNQAYTLSQFYLYAGEMEKAEEAFTFFITCSTSIKILNEFLEGIVKMLFFLQQNGKGAGISPAAFESTCELWLKKITEKINQLKNIPVTAAAEIQSKLAELSSYEGELCHTALTASLARVNRNDKSFSGAFHNYLQLLNFPGLFSEAAAALTTLTNTSSELNPFVTSIAFEISEDLVPPDAESPNWHVVKELIPAMKKRVAEKYAITLPAVRIRGNDGDLAPGTCIFMLDEIPLLMCTVEKGKYFANVDDGSLKDTDPDFVMGINPLTGKHSGWVNENVSKTLIEKNVATWSDFDFIIYTLEALICNNLQLFVDDEYCQNYLTGNLTEIIKNETDDSVSSVVTTIAASNTQRLLFKNVLKNLVREKLPLKNRSAIINAFADAVKISNEVCIIAEQIRLAVKGDLPVNTLKLNHIGLPADAERLITESLTTEDGKIFLTMKPEDCQEALASIREVVESSQLPDTTALIVNNQALRYHVKKLVELEFPTLIVASPNEYKASE